MSKVIVMAVGIGLVAAAFGQSLGERAEQEAAGNAPSAKVAAARSPAPRAGGANTVALRADRLGHFQSDIQVNGQFVKALVDTGASVVAMSFEDARKAGILPPKGDFVIGMQTANGVVRAARARIPELRLQSITVHDVEAVVLPQGAINGTLLGMSFLKRLSSFEMNGNTLILKK